MKNKLLKILSIFLVMMFATALLPLAAVPAAAGWSGEGAGTDADPYKIGTATELYEFRDIVNGTHATVEQNAAACAVLTADIDLYGAAWTPIGTVDYNFTGVFDGQGHSIIGLYGVCGDAANIGLFGYVKYGTVKNLSVSGTFTASGEGDISIGGIVGTLWSGTVKNCRSTVTVRAAVEGDTSVNLVGGVVGYNLQGTVCDCYATGAIAVTYTGDYCINCVGGVVGFSVEGNVTNCYATGSVTAAGANLNHAGGVIGRLVGGTAAGCRSLYDGDVDWPYVLSDVVIGNITDATVTDCTTLTVAQFSDSDSFNGWDFENVWTMGEKCPLLKCFISAPAELSNTGSGTADDPYKIGTAAQLAEFRDIVNGTHDTVEKNQSACAVLTADVDLGNNSWAPIKSYTGTFDGQGHRITGLYVNGDLQHAGLFSRIRDGGKVQNLAVSGSVSTNRDNANAGGIAGMNEGIIESCRSTVSVSSDNALVSLGGIVGYNYEGGIVKSCYATGNVSGGELSDAGGVAGYNYKSTVTNCYATGNVSGGEYSEVGGVVGRFAEATITNCYSTGILSGGEGSDVGGVVGMATNATVKNCYCRSGWNVVGNNIDDSSTVTDCAVLTVMQFTDSANFVGFDFTNTWYMGASTPQLKCFIPAPAGLLETGSGTADDPYKIGTAAQLAEFRDIVNGTHMTAEKNAAACAVLTADVDLGGEEWTPIGTDSYTGTFDGQGRSIKGLYVSNQYMYFGLFGCVGEGGTVKNLTVGGTINTQDASTSSEDVKAGGVVGFLSKGTVENCRSTVTVTVVSDPAYILAGGVVGHTTKGTITNCCATGAVSASGGGDANIAGGVVGYNIQGSVTNCCATGAVSASGSSEDNYAGGVVGLTIKGPITNCYATGAVSASGGGDKNIAGGVVGRITNSTVKNCCHLTGTAGDAIGDELGDCSVTNVSALTAAQFKDSDNFDGFDFTNTWIMGTDRPMLRCFTPSAASFGTDVLRTGANSTKAQLVRFGGLSWYVIAYDGKDENGQAITYEQSLSYEFETIKHTLDLYPAGTITLISKDAPKYGNYKNSWTGTAEYATSDLKKMIDGEGGMLSILSAKEQAAIISRTLQGGTGTYDDGASAHAPVPPYDSNNIIDEIFLENVLLWPLSVAEALQMDPGLRAMISPYCSSWWLRTPGFNPNYVAYVDGYNGNVLVTGEHVKQGAWYDVRSAFFLDLSSVLFTSAAVGGKSGTVGTLGKIGKYSGSEWKLTLLDDSRSDFTAAYDSVDGDVWTIKYSGATSGDGEYISAMIVNADGEMTYYGRLAAAESGDGKTVTVDLSGKYNDGDKLYVFNEQYNGDNKTDYSSELKEIKKPYEVIIYLSYNTIHTATSGSGWQHVKDGDEIVPAVYEAMNGYYFPTDYTVDSVNGISVTRDSYTQITVSGTPTGDLAITLPPPTQKEKEETPTATFTATGADTGMLTDVSVGMQYSVEEDVWYNITEVPMNITDVTAEYGVEVRMPSTDTNTKLDSDIQVISVTKAATPTLEATQPETINDKGVIPTTAAHEFSTDGTTWESCDGPLTDLDAGVYYVRVKATGTALASDAQEIAIAVGKCVVTFVNEDGTVLQKSEYSCGETPVFGGATPTKDSDGNVTLVFVGWSPKIVSATEDTTYTAMFGIPTSQKCRICGETLYVDPDETTETHHHLYCYNEDCSAYGVLAAEVKHSGGVATCTHKAVCEVCGVEYGNVDRRNHDWDEGVITLEPTCTESGFMILTCKYDNSHTLLKILTPTGHVEGEPVIENAVAATCTAEGGYDVVIYCSVCGEEISRVRVTQDALGHDYGEWVVTKPATCAEAGIETRVCSRCGEEETRTIPALGHDYGEWVVTKPATCTEAGVETRVCSHDSGHKETHAIAALGHDFGEWVVTVEPTETSEGVETRSCSRCGETETRSIPPLGHTHDMTYHEAVAPTKTEDGSKAYYVCESCGKWFEDADGAIEITDHDSVVIPALGETEPVVYGFKTTPETKWQKGSGNDYVLTSLADFSKFVGVKVDGEFIDASHFTAEESSTKVAFKADYLETLSDGEHTLTIVSEDGEATVKINIDPAPSEPDDTPEERKSSPVIPIIIIAIVIAAAATAAVVIIVKKKKKA